MKSVTRFITGHLDTIRQQYGNLCSHQSDPETIHRIRVSIRHLNAACILFKTDDISEKDKQIVRRYQKLSKHVFKTLSHPRDVEVQIALAQSIQTQLNDQQPELEFYIDKLRSEERMLTQQLIHTINRYPLNPVTIALEQSLKSYRFKTKDLVKKIRQQYKKARKQLKTSLNELNAHPENFHKTRVKLKKYRYILELERHIFNKKNTRLKRLKVAQEQLGNANDLLIATQLMTQHGVNSEVIVHTRQRYQASLSDAIRFLLARKSQYL